jgi:transcription antitermination factor NusG
VTPWIRTLSFWFGDLGEDDPRQAPQKPARGRPEDGALKNPPRTGPKSRWRPLEFGLAAGMKNLLTQPQGMGLLKKSCLKRPGTAPCGQDGEPFTTGGMADGGTGVFQQPRNHGMSPTCQPIGWSALPPLWPGGVPAPYSWIVVKALPCRERRLQKELDSAGFPTFLPFVKEWRTKRRTRWGRTFEEKRRRDVLAFPGYVFVCTGLDAPDWRLIASFDDVVRILGPDPEHPYTVPASAMSAMFEMAYANRQPVDPLPALFDVGATYRVKQGPFFDRSGVCTWAKGERLRLLFSLFGDRDIEVEFTAPLVEAKAKP